MHRREEVSNYSAVLRRGFRSASSCEGVWLRQTIIIYQSEGEKAWRIGDLFPVQEFLHDQSDCRILRHHVNRPRFLVVLRAPGRSAVFAVLPWRKGTAGLENKAFPCCSYILSQCIVRLVNEFRVNVSVCRRSKSGSPSCQSQRHGRGSPGQRLSFEAATGLYLPRLWPPTETQSLHQTLSKR